MNNHPIKLADSTIDSSELKSLSNWVLDNNQLTKGKVTLEFEKEFSNYIGCKYSVFVNSGSSANLLIYYALLESGMLRNKKVIIPTISWITTLSPAIQFGMTPILCEADSKNLGLDIHHFESLCKTHQPAMVILVHVLGHSNNMLKIKRICKKYDVLLVEDTCEALGSEINGHKLGNLGIASSFSFYYGHHISTIEGGMVCTNNQYLYNLFLSIRSHGWSRDLEEKYLNHWKKEYDIDEFRNYYTFYFPGFNLRSTDLNAFIGKSQLKKINSIVTDREENFNIYKDRLKSHFWVQQSDTDVLSSFAFGTFVKNRTETYQYLRENNIESRPLVCGSMGRQPFWIKKYGVQNFIVADKIHDYGIYLPNHIGLDKMSINYVCDKFLEIAEPI